MHVALLQCMLSRWFTTTSPLRLCVSTPSASLRVEGYFETTAIRCAQTTSLSPHHVILCSRAPITPPAIAQHTPSPSPICLIKNRPASSQATTRHAKRRRMAKRAIEDLSEAGDGPQDGFNDATADVP